jgi:hypothetical protein
MKTRIADMNSTQKSLIALGGIAVLYSCTAAAAQLQQPREIPGSWNWKPQSLPAIETIAARPAPQRPVYGLYCWADEYRKNREFIKDVGWTNFRLSGPISDEIMQLYIEDEAEVMFTMPARKPFREPGATQGKWRNRADFESDEAFIADYLGDVESVIRRYGPDGSFFADNPDLPKRPLTHIEIFNEPNFWYLDTAKNDRANHFPPKDRQAREALDRSREALYANMLTAAYTRIKQLAPSIQVVGMAAGGASGADVPFIKGVFNADPATAQSLDILSTHPYSRPAPPDAYLAKSWADISIADRTQAVRNMMNARSIAEKPLWWTELNWSIFPDHGGTFNEKKVFGFSKDVTPELQAAYLVRGYALALRLGVERVHYMAIHDTDGCNAGMLNSDGSYRPAAIAVKTMIAQMPRPKLLGAITENEDGTYMYRFDPDFSQSGDDRVVMAWRVQGPKTVSIPWKKRTAQCIDMLGNTTTVNAQKGALQLEIGPLPIYLK